MLGRIEGLLARRGLRVDRRLGSIKKIKEEHSFVFPKPAGEKSAHKVTRVTTFAFPKSEKQLLEEREDLSLNIRASGITKRALEKPFFVELNKKLDRHLEPELNQRRYELWNGMWETWSTASIAVRLSCLRVYNRFLPISQRRCLELTYSETMQLDRSKREFAKLLVAMTPFFVIPGSLLWWFPCCMILAKLFPSYIMPAHYMRGRAARVYYTKIHKVRSGSYNEITANLNYIRNTKFCPFIVTKVLRDVHTGKLPNVDDILELHAWIKKEDKIHYTVAPNRIQNAYSKMLLNWMQLLAYSPKVIRSRNIDKRLKTLLEMDNQLRENGTVQSLTKGQLSEALFIRGVNGFEDTLSREAKLFWLENWLTLTNHISSKDIQGQSYEGSPVDANATYVMLSMFLWAVNFNQNNFLLYKQNEHKNGGRDLTADKLHCPHCGFDCTDHVEAKIGQLKTGQNLTHHAKDIQQLMSEHPPSENSSETQTRKIKI